MPPERVGGDRAIHHPQDAGTFLAIVDVLGHGPDADVLAAEIEQFLDARPGEQIAELMCVLHDHLNGTRGAAVGLCWVDARTGEARHVGTGNTSFRRLGSEETRLVSRDGVLGERMRTPFEQKLTLSPGDLVLLSTDGVRSFSPDEYHTIRTDPVERIARTVVRKFAKEHDDAACVALRYEP